MAKKPFWPASDQDIVVGCGSVGCLLFVFAVILLIGAVLSAAG